MDKKHIISGVLIMVFGTILLSMGKKFFTTYISIPMWLFITLLLLSLILILILIFKLRSPEHKKYTEDIFDNMKWRWNYDLFKNITDPTPYCLYDDTVLVYSDWREETSFECETCKRKYGPFSGKISYNKNRIKRQIDRKIRNKVY